MTSFMIILNSFLYWHRKDWFHKKAVGSLGFIVIDDFRLKNLEKNQSSKSTRGIWQNSGIWTCQKK